MTVTAALAGWCRSLIRALERETVNRGSQLPSLIYPEIHIKTDTLTASACAILLFSLRMLIIYLVSERWFPKARARIKRKISENLFYTMYHSSSVFLFTLVMKGESWTLRPFTDEMIVQGLTHPRFPPLSPLMRFLYMYDLGFWISATFFICFFDKRLSDFRILFFHHLASIALILTSYRFGYVRFGVLLMALHDIGDVFLYGAKFVHYLRYNGWDTAIFAVFAVVFYVTRLLVLPRLIYAAAKETLQIGIDVPGFNEWFAYIDVYIWHWLVLVILLCALQVLHCFWFSLVLRMAYRELFLGKKITDEGDIRDSSDSDSDMD